MHEIEAEILALERASWDANIAEDAAAFRALAADDFLAVTAFGVFDKAAMLAQLAAGGTPFTGYAIEDAQVRVPAPGAALTTYRVSIDAVRGGQTLRLAYFATSLYARGEDGAWRLRLTQQTPALTRDQLAAAFAAAPPA